MHIWEIFVGESFINNLFTTLLQIVCKFMLYSKVILKSMTSPDDNFTYLSTWHRVVHLERQVIELLDLVPKIRVRHWPLQGDHPEKHSTGLEKTQHRISQNRTGLVKTQHRSRKNTAQD